MVADRANGDAGSPTRAKYSRRYSVDRRHRVVTLGVTMKELFQHTAITDGVTVRVAVNFLPEQSRIEAGKWFWVYHIRIENHSEQTLHLVTRHWRITDGHGGVNFVEGEGVVGEQPVLRPGQSHDYVSGCPLSTSQGSMEGYYTFRQPNGSELRAAIPFFPLAAPATAR
jgi:ApaG protein